MIGRIESALYAAFAKRVESLYEVMASGLSVGDRDRTVERFTQGLELAQLALELALVAARKQEEEE